MSTGINGLLSTFKTNMMNNGVSVAGSDKFKQLIDKLALLADSGDSGIQYAEGISVINSNTETNMYTDLWGNTQNISTLRIDSLNFKPNIVLLYTNAKTPGITTYIKGVCLISGMPYKFNSSPANWALKFNDDDISFDNGFVVPCSTYGTCNWYAIGVGEEDTTLRDSLASILENKGVDVTEEDDLASLITKVDTEFNKLENLLLSKKDFVTGTVTVNKPSGNDAWNIYNDSSTVNYKYKISVNDLDFTPNLIIVYTNNNDDTQYQVTKCNDWVNTSRNGKVLNTSNDGSSLLKYKYNNITNGFILPVPYTGTYTYIAFK